MNVKRRIQKRCHNLYIPRFTLVELVTVVAVLAILLSLLLPALGRAHRAAQSVSCSNKLRQIGTASAVYTNDYDGYVMPAFFSSKDATWIDYFHVRHDFAPDIFKCPAYSDEECFNPYGEMGSDTKEVKRGTYIMNTISEGEDSWEGSTITRRSSSTGWCNGTTNPILKSRVNNPAGTIVMTEVKPECESSAARGIVTFLQTDHGNSNETNVSYPHDGQFNILWGDGHTSSRFVTKDRSWVAVE